MGEFRIGRKHASHSYPTTPATGALPSKQVDRFSTLLAPASDENAFIANGGALPQPNPFKYPTVEATGTAKLVVNVRANTTAVATLRVALTKDGGLTLVGALTWAPGETGIKRTSVTFPLTVNDSYDVALVFDTIEVATVDLTATVELIP